MRTSVCLSMCMFSCMNTDQGLIREAVRDCKLFGFSAGLGRLSFCHLQSGLQVAGITPYSVFSCATITQCNGKLLALVILVTIPLQHKCLAESGTTSFCFFVLEVSESFLLAKCGRFLLQKGVICSFVFSCFQCVISLRCSFLS